MNDEWTTGSRRASRCVLGARPRSRWHLWRALCQRGPVAGRGAAPCRSPSPRRDGARPRNSRSRAHCQTRASPKDLSGRRGRRPHSPGAVVRACSHCFQTARRLLATWQARSAPYAPLARTRKAGSLGATRRARPTGRRRAEDADAAPTRARHRSGCVRAACAQHTRRYRCSPSRSRTTPRLSPRPAAYACESLGAAQSRRQAQDCCAPDDPAKSRRRAEQPTARPPFAFVGS
mmetsp:Transcript_48514/g.127782  ORF Transcript_48514/g.127782 Transcript_48514/m.127782 type:complete len:233 (-) Transcript_48514:52-750(-)